MFLEVRQVTNRENNVETNSKEIKKSDSISEISKSTFSQAKQTKDSDSLQHKFTRNLNELSATWMSFLSRILIERTYFQNYHIPYEVLLCLTNDLVRTLVPQKEETLNISKEMTILWKQLWGEDLTCEEEQYDSSPKQLDVAREFVNGLSLSSTMLLGHELYSSLYSTISEGLWSHVPAIVGYSGVTLFGYQRVSYVVDKLLQNTKFSKEQQDAVRPWLNTIGQLAIGFIPKVHANEKGVHYLYPSTEGSIQVFSKEQITTVQGDRLSIERNAILETPLGEHKGTVSAYFKLHRVYELSDERVRIQVIDHSGKSVPIEFKNIQGKYGPEVEVICDDKDLANYWTKLIYPEKAGVEKQLSKQMLDCSMNLVGGALGSLITQNVIPLSLFAFSCLGRSDASSRNTLKKTEIISNEIKQGYGANQISYQEIDYLGRTHLEKLKEADPTQVLQTLGRYLDRTQLEELKKADPTQILETLKSYDGRRIELIQRLEGLPPRTQNLGIVILNLQTAYLESKKTFKAPVYSVHDKMGNYLGAMYPSIHQATPNTRSFFPEEVKNVFQKSAVAMFESDPDKWGLGNDIQKSLIQELQNMLKNERAKKIEIKSNPAYQILKEDVELYEKMIVTFEKVLEKIQQFNPLDCTEKGDLISIKNLFVDAQKHFNILPKLTKNILEAVKWLSKTSVQNKQKAIQNLLFYPPDIHDLKNLNNQMMEYTDFLDILIPSKPLEQSILYGIELTLYSFNTTKPRIELNSMDDKDRIDQTKLKIRSSPSNIVPPLLDGVTLFDCWAGWNRDVINNNSNHPLMRGSEGFAKPVLDDTSISWSKKITEYIAKNPKKRFFATAGFMHFTGKYSLVKLMEQAGFIINEHDPYETNLSENLYK